MAGGIDQYAVNRLMETHELVFEVDAGADDAFGAHKADWQPYMTIKGLYWWWESRTGAGGFVEEGDAERNVDKAGGGALVARGTEIEEQKHRVGKVLLEGQVEVEGPFRIVSVRETPTHMEISLIRP